MTIRWCLVRVGAAVVAVLTSSSCAGFPAYESVPMGQPSAEMKFLKSFSDPGFGGGAGNSYSLSADENCSTVRDAGRFAWPSGDENVLRVVPGAPTIVWAKTDYWLPEGQQLVLYTCGTAVRFTPERDHAYDVRQPTKPRIPGCQVEVVDRATGAPPPDVTRLNLNECIDPAKAKN